MRVLSSNRDPSRSVRGGQLSLLRTRRHARRWHDAATLRSARRQDVMKAGRSELAETLWTKLSHGKQYFSPEPNPALELVCFVFVLF